jgi:integrase
MGSKENRPEDEFEDKLRRLNTRLKAGNTGVRVEQRGGRLGLSACLPDRDGQNRRSRRISLRLPANAVGLKEAEGRALRLAADLTQKRFPWEDWSQGESGEKETIAKTCAHWIAHYKAHLWSNKLNGDEATKDKQWRRNFYNPALKWLPQDEPLTANALIIAALHHDAIGLNGKPTRARQKACTLLGAFAKWACAEVDLKPYQGKYSPSQIERNIPSDEAIVEAVSGIKNPSWRWAAAMMAAYGLRDHECWMVEIREENGEFLAYVLKGKTGDRIVRPLHPEWVNLWDLPNGSPPEIKVRGHEEFGERMSRHFKRSGIPFTPYDLRHAYAIRSSVRYKIPVSVSAAHMGHSPEVHMKTYNKHLSEVTKRAAYDEAIAARGSSFF